MEEVKVLTKANFSNGGNSVVEKTTGMHLHSL